MMKNSEAMRLEMLEKPMGRLLFEKSYPTVIIQLISVVYNTADTYFVAKINTESAAAAGVVFSLMSIIQAVGFGIGMGANSLISRSLGAQNNKKANLYGSTATFSGIVFGILLMVVGLFNINGFMRLIGASETVLPYAISYARYILIAAPFMCLAFVLNNILKAEGQSFFAMIGMTAGGLLNLVLDPWLIFGLDMGISGAAISIANKVYMLIRNIILGIGQGYQPIAGYCYGAGKRDRVKKAFLLSSIAGTLICSIFAILAFLFRVPIITWFSSDKEVIAVGAHALQWFCISMPLLAYSTYVNQTYQCLGYSVGATFLASCRQGIFFIPLALILPKLIGLTGIEMLQATADIITFLISIPFQIWFFKRNCYNI